MTTQHTCSIVVHVLCAIAVTTTVTPNPLAAAALAAPGLGQHPALHAGQFLSNCMHLHETHIGTRFLDW